tara:strand:- start:179 stop:292 length:114 start_codon:yes stop_codon:yes gene_type:complete
MSEVEDHEALRSDIADKGSGEKKKENGKSATLILVFR